MMSLPGAPFERQKWLNGHSNEMVVVGAQICSGMHDFGQEGAKTKVAKVLF